MNNCPYPAYKPSGVPWLGKVPAHWEVRRLKHLSTINDDVLGEGTDPDFEMLYVDISGVDSVYGITNKEQLLFKNAPSRARRRARNGDVIISTVRTYLRAIVPIADPEPNLVVSTGFVVIRPTGVLTSSFAAYTLRAPYFVDGVVARSVGVSYPGINPSDLVDLHIALPPPSEQKAIAAFLDRETVKVDELIVKKESLVALLVEKRAALISRAVTRGLDPNVPFKDSGVPWLGEIPAHWSLMKTKYLCCVNPSKNEIRYIDRDLEVSFVPMEKITNHRAMLLDSTKEIREVWNGYTYFVNGDVLVAKITPCFENGKGALCEGLYNGMGFGTTELHVLRPGINISGDYLFYVTNATYVRERGVAFMFGTAGQKRIPADYFAGLLLPLPRIDEQKEIVAFLDRETSKIDALVAKVRDGIELLKEYRTALISATVTGKIDVQG